MSRHCTVVRKDFTDCTSEGCSLSPFRAAPSVSIFHTLPAFFGGSCLLPTMPWLSIAVDNGSRSVDAGGGCKSSPPLRSFDWHRSSPVLHIL